VPHDPHLASRMCRAMGKRSGITEKKMFGGFLLDAPFVLGRISKQMLLDVGEQGPRNATPLGSRVNVEHVDMTV
jgi:hypothetical protein